MRRFGGFAIIEEASTKRWDAEALEVSVGDDSKVGGAPQTFLLLEEPVEGAAQRLAVFKAHFWNFILRHQHERAIGKAPGHGKAAGRADFAHAGNLFEAVDQAGEEGDLRGLLFGSLGPGERDIHRDDVIDAKAGINFEDLHQAASEESGTDDKNKGDSDLRRDDDASDTLAALRPRLRATTFAESFADIAGSGTYSGEDAETDGNCCGEE